MPDTPAFDPRTGELHEPPIEVATAELRDKIRTLRDEEYKLRELRYEAEGALDQLTEPTFEQQLARYHELTEDGKDIDARRFALRQLIAGLADHENDRSGRRGGFTFKVNAKRREVIDIAVLREGLTELALAGLFDDEVIDRVIERKPAEYTVKKAELNKLLALDDDEDPDAPKVGVVVARAKTRELQNRTLEVKTIAEAAR